MRPTIVLVVFFLSRSAALAVCPPDCVGGGGGSPSTDCFVGWSGLPSLTATCTDGDACDADGKADGTCTFPLAACINVPGVSDCTPGTLDAAPTVKPTSTPTGQQLAGALAALGTSGTVCTTPGVAVPLKVGLSGIKAGKVRLTVTAASGGKRDKDKLKLTCLPSSVAPSFANVIQPIFTAKCATTGGCHDSSFRAGANGSRPGQVLEAGVAYGESVGVASSESPKLQRVKPGSIKSSMVARKILNQGLPKLFATQMPLGCPGGPLPVGGCLTPDEELALLYWIANGAPNN